MEYRIRHKDGSWRILESTASAIRNAKGETERGAIAQALGETHWNRKAAARLLNISYRALLYKIQEYQMAPPAESARLIAVDGLRQVK